MQCKAFQPDTVRREIAEYMIMDLLFVNSLIKKVSNGTHGVAGIISVLKIAGISDYPDIDRSNEITVVKLTAFHGIDQKIYEFLGRASAYVSDFQISEVARVRMMVNHHLLCL